MVSMPAGAYTLSSDDHNDAPLIRKKPSTEAKRRVSQQPSLPSGASGGPPGKKLRTNSCGREANEEEKPRDQQAQSPVTIPRKKDKEPIPSPKVLVWDEQRLEFAEKDRPIVHQFGPFFTYQLLPPAQLEMLRKLAPSLSLEFLQEHLVPRLDRVHPCSLRNIDWAVVDYARAKEIVYVHKVPDTANATADKTIIDVHEEYASMLRQCKRQNFDPFRRRQRVYFTITPGGVPTTYATTVAQLHFFKEAHEKGFLTYAETHLEEIIEHMAETLRASKQAKREAQEKGKCFHRQPLVTKAERRPLLLKGHFTFRFSDEPLVKVD